MKTFNRVCIKDHEETDVLGRRLKLERGKAYLTSQEKNGVVIVFTHYVFEDVPANLFASQEEE